MKVQREVQYTPEKVCVVVNPDSVRTYLNALLPFTEVQLGIDISKIALMPYALVVCEDQDQTILPIGVERDTYKNKKKSFKNCFEKPYPYALTNFASLKEYELQGAGLIVNNTLQGSIYESGYMVEDESIDVIEYNYGPYPYKKVGIQFFVSHRINDIENRSTLDKKLQKTIQDAEKKFIVTLGMPDNFLSIIRGERIFKNDPFLNENWVLKE